MMRRYVILSGAVLTSLVLGHPSHAQTTAGCQAVLTAASSASEDEIQYLRQNVIPPQPIAGLTCLAVFESAASLSADMIVNTMIEGLLSAVVGQVCNLVDDYWQGFLNQLRCGISIGGPGLGFPGLGGGTVCQFNIGGNYGTLIQMNAGVGAGGGGFYVPGQAVEVDPYGQ